MNLKLQNSWKYVGDAQWEWSAYLTGSDLHLVKNVEYILHPTFKNPLKIITDPTHGFRLNRGGWGSFILRAIVHLKDGTDQFLSHELRLEFTPEIGSTDA